MAICTLPRPSARPSWPRQRRSSTSSLLVSTVFRVCLDGGAGKIKGLNRVTAICPGLRAVALFRRCQELAAELFQARALYVFDHAIYKEAGGGMTAWHQDQAYTSSGVPMSTLHFWIPLHDVSRIMVLHSAPVADSRSFVPLTSSDARRPAGPDSARVGGGRGANQYGVKPICSRPVLVEPCFEVWDGYEQCCFAEEFVVAIA